MRAGPGGDRGDEVPLAESMATSGHARASESETSYPRLTLAAISLGAIVMVAGLFWAWQAWSARASAPIDDSLPFLIDTAAEPASVESGATPVADAAVADAAGAGSAGAGSAEPSGAGGGVSAPSVVGSSDDPIELEAGPTSTPTPMLVHVSGAVQAPGVVELAPGARAIDALTAAGGAVVDTDLDRVNLAAPMFDGERLHFPVVGEDDPPEIVEPIRPFAVEDDPRLLFDDRVATGGVATPTPRPAVVDINTADLIELQLLPGIGPAMASRILEKRQSYGFFCTVDELLDIRGIGPETLESLRALVRIARSDCPTLAGG